MDRSADPWQACLPENLHPHVAWPVRVEAHHDDSVPASKWRGYDVLGLQGDGRPCGMLADSGFKVVPPNEIPRL